MESPLAEVASPAKCLNDRLCMHQHVVGVLLEDVLTGLCTNLVDKGLKQVDRYLWLAALNRGLGGVELGDETARNPVVVDVAKLRGMLHTFP